MLHNQSFDDMMARLQAGDNDAATQVFNRFAHRLIDLARRKLDPQMRQKLDPEDVLQSVFRSFFAHQAAGQVTALASWDNLWAWLVVITMRKCGRRIEYFHSASRDVHRELPAPVSEDESSGDNGSSSDEPTPSEAAMLTETVEQLMNNLEGRHREILALSLQGHTAPEISAQVGCTERTAYRVLKRVKEMLEDMRVEADP
jgi:RNA polymerase sigma-70 factor (ECF subfamily)